MYLFSAILIYVICINAHLYCVSRSCVNRTFTVHIMVWCNSCCEEDERRSKGFSKCIKATLRFSMAGINSEMTAFYMHRMASEIKPGRGLKTKLTTGIPGWLGCLRMLLISSVWIQQSFLWLMPARFCSLLLLFSAIKISMVAVMITVFFCLFYQC